MSKKLYLCGNWKMNHGPQKAREWCQKAQKPNIEEVEIVIFPQALACEALSQVIPEWMKWGVQNLSHETAGAHTGENDGQVAKEMGASYCLCGHSERRTDQMESSALVAQKAARALEVGLVPIVCVGETEEEREKGLTESIIKAQIEPLRGLEGYLIAYEPLWAIGTGKTATPEQAEDTCAYIKTLVDVPVLYGGSVNKANGASLLTQKSIDGALVGGASLKPEEFFAIITELS